MLVRKLYYTFSWEFIHCPTLQEKWRSFPQGPRYVLVHLGGVNSGVPAFRTPFCNCILLLEIRGWTFLVFLLPPSPTFWSAHPTKSADIPGASVLLIARRMPKLMLTFWNCLKKNFFIKITNWSGPFDGD